MSLRDFRAARYQSRLIVGVLLAVLITTGGCSKKATPTEPAGSATAPVSIAIIAGNSQSAPLRRAVATAPSVIVKDASGRPCGGVVVLFAVTSGGGTVSGSPALTNPSGIATAAQWTMGEALGANALSAKVNGHSDLVANFEATARLPHWSVLVYMAADNTLAVQGIQDIDEMEAAGADPDVQVVIEAEFSRTALSQAGCADPSCFHRPNWNTFRYAITGQGTDVTGPNGDAIDIGDRNMADPAQLREFLTWAKQNYPAERCCLVLWNHGGGYTGLLEDQTAGQVMSIGELPAALSGVGPIDVCDFDMSLMGAYETLSMINGYARYAVFSEEVVPGEGNPYAAILGALQAGSEADAPAFARLIADQFYGHYTGNRASTTVSAFDLGQFGAFEASLNDLATGLDQKLPPLVRTIGSAAARSQHYTMPEIKDLVDLLDTLQVGVSDLELLDKIQAVRTQATGTFCLRNYHRNGIGYGENDVSHSHGLSVVLPSGASGDRFADEGPRSFASYSVLYSGKPWTQFLTDYLAHQESSNYADQDAGRFEAYLVWNTSTVDQGVDIDMWVLEPDGNLYIPYLGSVTPNGTLTNDSADDHVSFEGYMTNKFIEPGEYRIYASLYADPQNRNPSYDVAYRFNQIDQFRLMYDPERPSLTTAVSWQDDSTPTLQEAEHGEYTDLQLAAVATLPIVTPAPAMLRGPAPGVAGSGFGSGGYPTTEQLVKVRELRKSHRWTAALARSHRSRPWPMIAGGNFR